MSLFNVRVNANLNKYILNIKKSYNIFKNLSSRDIKFFWIPSHSGIQGNDTVDALAKAATDSNSADINSVPFSDLFENFKKESVLETNNLTRSLGLTKGVIYFYPSLFETSFFFDCNLYRNSHFFSRILSERATCCESKLLSEQVVCCESKFEFFQRKKSFSSSKRDSNPVLRVISRARRPLD